MATQDLDVQQEAMAVEAAGSSPDASGKGRSSPIDNAITRCETIVSTMRTGWAKDATDGKVSDLSADEVAEQVDLIFSGLLSAMESYRAEPRAAETAGKHYLAVRTDGTRVHIQCTGEPTAKRFPDYAAVYGPFAREQGATFRQK